MATTSATVTATWTPPAALTGFSATVVEAQSLITLDWDSSQLATTDFDYYQLYRRLAGDTTWTAYATILDQTASNYSDYFAGQQVTYEYKVTQLQKVPGDVDLESTDSAIVTAELVSDVWFVIGADFSPSHSFELPVVDEKHTQPVQQEQFEPVGSRRKKVVRGNTLGMEGDLTAQWSATTDDPLQTPDLAKLYVDYILQNAGPHILKTPFGDVWQVEFGSSATASYGQYVYTQGGNLSVQLPWVQVI